MSVYPQIWTVTDGHAGNRRQAEALAAALSPQPTPDRVVSPSTLARVLAPRRFFGAATQLGDAFADALQGPVPGLAIGCGRQAALATRLLRERGSQAVQILDPRLDTRHWDLVVAPEHDRLHGDNVLTLVGSLNPVDDHWLQQARDHFAAFAALPSPRVAILLGGSTRHARQDDAAVIAWVQQVDAMVREQGGSVLLTGSRRTSAAARPALRAHFKGNAGVLWLDADDGDNPYPGLLGWADRIVCSADSVNMVSEACATHAPVFVHAPERVEGRPRRFLESLLACARIRPLGTDLSPFAVTPLRETERIAADVAARLRLPTR